MKRLRRRLFSPLAQVFGALAGMFGGATLVDVTELFALGVTVIVVCAVLVLDGLFRQPRVPDDARELTAHQQVLERFRRAP